MPLADCLEGGDAESRAGAGMCAAGRVAPDEGPGRAGRGTRSVIREGAFRLALDDFRRAGQAGDTAKDKSHGPAIVTHGASLRAGRQCLTLLVRLITPEWHKVIPLARNQFVTFV
jgi:hypothetical protein